MAQSPPEDASVCTVLPITTGAESTQVLMKKKITNNSHELL